MAQVTGILRPRRRENPAACTGLHSWSRTEGRRRRPAAENGNSMIFAPPQVSSRLPQDTSSELQIELQPSDCEVHTRDSLGKTTTPLTVPAVGSSLGRLFLTFASTRRKDSGVNTGSPGTRRAGDKNGVEGTDSFAKSLATPESDLD